MDDRAGGADDPAEHGLLEEVEPRLGAEDLLLQLVDVLLERPETHGVRPLIGSGPALRRGGRGLTWSGRSARRRRRARRGRGRRRRGLGLRRSAYHQRDQKYPQGAVRPTRKNGQRCHVVTPSGVRRGVLGGPEERSRFEAAFLYQDPQVRSIFGFSAFPITAVATSTPPRFLPPRFSIPLVCRRPAHPLKRPARLLCQPNYAHPQDQAGRAVRRCAVPGGAALARLPPAAPPPPRRWRR